MPADVSGSPVLLLHGSGPGTTAAAWDPLVAALAPRHRVIAPDLLGFGAGPRPAGSLRAAWTRQALEVVDGLGVTSFAVVGNSAGAVPNPGRSGATQRNRGASAAIRGLHAAAVVPGPEPCSRSTDGPEPSASIGRLRPGQRRARARS